MRQVAGLTRPNLGSRAVKQSDHHRCQGNNLVALFLRSKIWKRSVRGGTDGQTILLEWAMRWRLRTRNA
jgi:hypothetical protein